MSLQVRSYNAPLALVSLALFHSNSAIANSGSFDEDLEDSDTTTTAKVDTTTTAKADTTATKADTTIETTGKTAVTTATTEATTATQAVQHAQNSLEAAAESGVAEFGAHESDATKTNAVSTEATTADGDKDTSTTVWWTPSVTVWWTPTTTYASASAIENALEDSSKSDTISYNQDGFTGSQSVWDASTFISVYDSSSTSSGSSSIASVTNKTSDSTRIHNPIALEKDYTWKKTMLIGGVIGVSMFLNAL